MSTLPRKWILMGSFIRDLSEYSKHVGYMARNTRLTVIDAPIIPSRMPSMSYLFGHWETLALHTARGPRACRDLTLSEIRGGWFNTTETGA